MKNISVISIFILLALYSKFYSQNNLMSIRDSIFNELTTKFKDSNLYKTGNNTIIWMYVDSFTVRNKISAIRSRQKLDTIIIKLIFEDNWDYRKIEEIKLNNSQIINDLSNRFIAYMDSINWKGIKTNKSMFLNDRVQELKWYYTPFLGNKNGEFDNFENIRRLPDFSVNNNTGVFIDCSPDLYYLYIVENEIKNYYYEKLEIISEDIFKLNSVKIGREQYE